MEGPFDSLTKPLEALTNVATGIGSNFEELASNLAEAFVGINANSGKAADSIDRLVDMAKSLFERFEEQVTAVKSRVYTLKNLVDFGIAFKAYYDYLSESSLYLARIS